MERKDFLKLFGVASTAITLPAITVEAQENVATIPKQDKIVRLDGTVKAKGKGITGVAVTDGTTVVLTDRNGNYSFESDAEADFVYISIPAGYAFPQEKKIARFYERINKQGESFNADFVLEPLQQDDTKHNFIVWADTQMISEKDVELLKKQSVPDLQKLVASYPKDTLFHGIGCGDLVWDKFELFKGYKEAKRKLKLGPQYLK